MDAVFKPEVHSIKFFVDDKGVRKKITKKWVKNLFKELSLKKKKKKNPYG